MEKQGKSNQAGVLREAHKEYERNRMAFFLAHGQGRDFLNDTEHELLFLRAPERTGKTFHMLAWVLLNLLPCDASWPCFTEHGIKRRQWNGPMRIGLASYELLHLRRNLWPKLLELLPVDEAREYSPLWKPKDSRMQLRRPNFQNCPSFEAACGSVLDMYCYRSPPEVFQSTAYNRWAFDEQVGEFVFDSCFARGLTIGDFQATIAFTPLLIEGVQESGAETWMHQLDTGILKKGVNHKTYTIPISDVPDAIMPKHRKEQAYQKYVVEPRRTGNLRAIRQGRARYYGEYESSEGLVFDNFMPWLHMIDPFPIPHGWATSLYRAVDPGRVHPFACLWWAMSPWGDYVFFREYREIGFGSADHVKNIIQASGNRRERVSEYATKDGAIMPVFEEKQVGEKYAWTVMDVRAFKAPHDEDGRTWGLEFRRLGLNCIESSGQHTSLAVPIMRDLFEVDLDRTHLLVRMGKCTKVMDKEGFELKGAPRIYFFSTMVKTRAELESYINQPGSEEPVMKNNDLMSCFKYAVLSQPRYRGLPTDGRPLGRADSPMRRGDRYTGYAGMNAQYEQ